MDYTTITNKSVSFSKDVLLTFRYVAIYPKLSNWASYASAQIFPKNITYYTDASPNYSQGIAVAVCSTKYGAGLVGLCFNSDNTVTYTATISEVYDVMVYIK